MLVFMTNFKDFWLVVILITKITIDEFQIAFKSPSQINKTEHTHTIAFKIVGGISLPGGVIIDNALKGMESYRSL